MSCNKKAMIEIQFHWIFILIVGAVILLFFATMIYRQKTVSETGISADVLVNLESIISGSMISTKTLNLLDIPKGTEISYKDCNQYEVGPYNKQTGTIVMFAPKKIAGRKLVTWALDWNVPYRVTNFLYLTSDDVRYILVDDVPSSYMPNPVLDMPFSTDANPTPDVSGNNNHGDVNEAEAAWISSGKIGGAYSFNGAKTGIRVSDDPSLDLTGEITITAWIYPSDFSKDFCIVSKYWNVMRFFVRSELITSPKKLHVLYSTNIQLIGSTQIQEDTWSHVATTYKSGSLKTYINGVQDASDTDTGVPTTDNRALKIGGQFDEVTACTNGRIDEVKIYNKALTAEQIWAIYNQENNPGSAQGYGLINEIDEEIMPDEITRDLVYYDNSDSSFKYLDGNNIRAKGNYKVRFVFYNSNPDPATVTVPSNLRNLGALDLTAVNIIPDTEDRVGTVEFYKFDGNNKFVLYNPSIPYLPYLKKEAVIGAIFTENPETYSCAMQKAFTRLNYVTQVYKDRTTDLYNYYSNPRLPVELRICSTHYADSLSRSLSAKTKQDLESLEGSEKEKLSKLKFNAAIAAKPPLEQISQYSTSFNEDNAIAIFKCAYVDCLGDSSLEEQNRALQQRSCPQIY